MLSKKLCHKCRRPATGEKYIFKAPQVLAVSI
jgi:hypothetical protein